MGCQIYFQTPLFSSLPSLQTKHQTQRVFNIFASSTNNNQQTQVSNITQLPKTKVYNVKFQTLEGCKLGISKYPNFEYNAQGGSGTGIATKIIENNDDLNVEFNIQTLYIPPLTSSTTKFLGLPLPPFLKINIIPEVFQGHINQVSGKVELEFKAKFLFSVGSIYQAPPLMVETVLTSEESNGKLRSGKGAKLNDDGKCSLVGVANVQPINDLFMNTFLSLPTECLANLNAIITFSTT